MEKIRKPAVAGAFYPEDKETLSNMIEEYLKLNAVCICKRLPKAIIVPHAGYVYSGIVAAAGYNCLTKLDQSKKWKVLLLGPSHFVPFKGAAVPESNIWETPLGNVQVKKLPVSDLIVEYEDPFVEEHSLEVQVPFLQKVIKDFTLYPLCLGEINTRALANELEDFSKQDDVIIVVSSDLSHFYTYDEAIKLDEQANKYFPSADIEHAQNVEACGIKGILTLLHLVNKLGLKGKMIDYKNSGDTAGDKSRVVGYGCYAFTK
ncbi:AmmeMemoRadiSam system protein B [Patescibacteria group bacterium]